MTTHDVAVAYVIKPSQRRQAETRTHLTLMPLVLIQLSSCLILVSLAKKNGLALHIVFSVIPFPWIAGMLGLLGNCPKKGFKLISCQARRSGLKSDHILALLFGWSVKELPFSRISRLLGSLKPIPNSQCAQIFVSAHYLVSDLRQHLIWLSILKSPR